MSTLPADSTPSPASSNRLFRGEGQHYGDLFPFADPMWMQDWYSPYYNESHFRMAEFGRKVCETILEPNADKWEENQDTPDSAYEQWSQLGLTAFTHAPEVYEYLRPDFPIPCGLKPNEIDGFHHLVLEQEINKVGAGGVIGGVTSGPHIGLPPVLRFGSEEMKRRVVPEVCEGRARICLAITEATGGSDVQNLQTTARKTDDGRFYVVNGLKKWISASSKSEYLTTAVRTGGPGGSGVSLLLIEKKFGGVTTRRIKTSGHYASTTSFVEFNDVRVPVTNLIGEEGEGFKIVMHNFNAERVMLIRRAISGARLAYEEALKYSHKRKTFGKLLIEHPVIRAKLANMARQIEASHAWLELCVYQMDKFKDKRLLNERIGGMTALLKVQATDILFFCTREASQILGGISYTRGGQGAKVERLTREVKLFSVGGGSEEVMMDFGIRNSLKNAVAMGAVL